MPRSFSAENPSLPAPRSVRCGARTLTFGRRPVVMGIVNVTPDSFSDGGQFHRAAAAIAAAREMASQGADVIDVGGESTRPGSDAVGIQEELDRVMPVLEALVADGGIDVPVSIDTRKARVAAEALRIGCHMVNDVSAAADPDMIDLLRGHETIPVVIMHMLGDPKTMQQKPEYDDVVGEVSAFLGGRAAALERDGIARERIVVDPGIGFGKRFRDNLDILNRIDAFHSLGYPLLVGASRKTFLGELLDAPPQQRLFGSLAVAARCYAAGVEMIRVHDVRETVQLLRVLDAIEAPENYTTNR